jgi:plastocyanin
MCLVRPFWQSAVLAAATLAGACGAAPSTGSAGATASPAVDPATTGRVTGRVRFDGPAPAAEMVRIDGDKACVGLNGTDQVPAEAVVVGTDGGVQHAFVYVKSGLEKRTFPIPAAPVIVDQQKCRYLPRVVGVRVGQALEILNGDPLLHNVRSDSAINQPFNQGQPVQGMRFSHTFTTREVMVPVKCDVHAWMRAYIGALEHPYFAVTGEDGAFTWPDLPPGSYVVEAWHERFGTIEQTLTVGPRESKDVQFTFVAR